MLNATVGKNGLITHWLHDAINRTMIWITTRIYTHIPTSYNRHASGIIDTHRNWEKKIILYKSLLKNYSLCWSPCIYNLRFVVQITIWSILSHSVFSNCDSKIFQSHRHLWIILFSAKDERCNAQNITKLSRQRSCPLAWQLHRPEHSTTPLSTATSPLQALSGVTLNKLCYPLLNSIMNRSISIIYG